jgi:flagellar basal body-associated protein FliL
MPLAMLVVFGQAGIAYLLVNKIVIQRLEGPPVEGIEEVKVDIAIGDEPERVYQGMGEFLVNPADTSSGSGLRFIKALVSLGVSPASVYTQLEAQQPKLRDAVITILTAKPVDKLDSPEDREFIKDEIRFAVNKMLHRGEVLQVYFSEFIIQ